ncbi:MAG: histidine kinase [Rheinheimera sp.]|nr:histidine kinase [Rheinheimera sp.]
MSELTANGWQSRLQRWWRISFQCSSAYLWVSLTAYLVYLVFYMLSMSVMFKAPNFETYLIATLRGLLDTSLMALFCHFLIRPYLKLELLPQGRYGSNLFGFLLYSLLLGQLLMFLSLNIADLTPLKEVDLRHMSLQKANGETMKLEIGLPILQLIGGFNQAVLFWLWALAYVFWGTLISKRQMQKQMHQAQLQQLTNQLNPHFLFNALNSIRALIYEDQDKAAATVTQLSELFRFHLQAHLKPLSTLADEWQIASQYLQIEQVRLEARLKLDLQFDEQLWQQKLPTLSLLTLVENAIKHGIAPLPQGGRLWIKSRPVANGWQLMVGNSCACLSSVHGTRTGLKNLRQRLALLPGRHSLHIEPQLDQYQVSIEIEAGPLDLPAESQHQFGPNEMEFHHVENADRR